MNKKEQPQSPGTTLFDVQSKDTNNQTSICEPEEKYCLWINQDIGEINVTPLSTPIEKVPLGFYVTCHIGTKNQLERVKRQIILSRIKPPKHHDRKAKI